MFGASFSPMLDLPRRQVLASAQEIFSSYDDAPWTSAASYVALESDLALERLGALLTSWLSMRACATKIAC